MKIQFNKYLYLLSLVATLTAFASCDDEIDNIVLSEQQQELIGKAVNFNVSLSDPFQTRTTYQGNGTFNENDLMRIYRQYWDGEKWCEEVYRTYNYSIKYALGSTIVIERDWEAKEGRTGWNEVQDKYHAPGTFNQQKSDSITWDDGRTVRFRAWSRSNYSGALYSSETSKQVYYPDYCVADWVNVSGPTLSIPLVLKHLGSRIAFSPKSGNQIYKVEISTDWQDYKRQDNSDRTEKDEHESESTKDDAKAQEECNAVIAAYNRMCLPGGIEEDENGHFILKAMTKVCYATQSNFDHLEDKDASLFYSYGKHSASEIAENVQHPEFSNVNGSSYLITIPYDMSNESTKGDIVSLPPFTRFRIYMRDVNSGDKENTSGYEATYHIFSLSDIQVGGKPKYPEGLEMLPGYSYNFQIGYLYDKFEITACDNFRWDDQQVNYKTITDATCQDTDFPTGDGYYTWWKNAIYNAIPGNVAGGSKSYNPEFVISNVHEFMEFIRLVNGTAGKTEPALYRLIERYEGEGANKKPVYGWSRTNDQRHPDWVSVEEAEAEGYLFYDHYHAEYGDDKAYSEQDYVKGPFQFNDYTFDLHFTVRLANDIDLMDIPLSSIGSTSKPFGGNFDGGNHVLKNLFMTKEALFDCIESAQIRNLQIESVHPTRLLNSGTVSIKGNYIAGVSINAPSSVNSIATSLTGMSFVVGCIHVGEAGGALVGTADNLAMSGCMQAASGINSGTGALLGSYADPKRKFFAPMLSMTEMKTTEKYELRPKWGAFMCNFYDTRLSPGTNAVGSIADDYSLWEYIRGRDSHILKAKNDNLLDEEVPIEKVINDDVRVIEFYGLAPWKAMNYAIYKYNQEHPSQKCDAHYVPDPSGYSHRYPTLVAGEAKDGDETKDDKGVAIKYSKINPLSQPN